MTKDLNKQIENITYNHLNLPGTIEITANNQSNYIYYTYDAAGIKLRKTAGSTTTDYVGSFIYENDELKYILTDYGKIVTDIIGSDTTFTRQYNLTDHLGNVRVSFNVKNDGTADIVQEDSYYPYGLTMNGLSFTNVPEEEKNMYLYNGKELQEDYGLEWYDYGARFYDPQIGRWHVVDPMAEFHHDYTSYAYVYNNPISFIDPFGLDTIVTTSNLSPDELEDGESVGEGSKATPRPIEEVVVTVDKPINLKKEEEKSKTYLNQGEQSEPTFVEKWANSDNIFAKFSYNTVNDAYQVVQVFDFDLLANEANKNPFTGASYSNIDGTPNYNQTEGVVNTVATLIPLGRAKVGLPKGISINKLNAAKFSKLFKGTFILKQRLGLRGPANRVLNKGINLLNNQVENGNVLFKAKSLNKKNK